MPEKSQTVTVSGYDVTRLQAIAYGTLQQLGWAIKYAGDNILIAYTPRNWNKHSDEITVKIAGNQLTVNSKMTHGEAFDMTGRNKKHITEFFAAFEPVKANATDQRIGEWNEKILLLKEETIKVAQQEIEQAKEVDKVMNFSKGNLYLTYGIIAVNVLVFVLMGLDGVSLFSPTGIDIIRWGANYAPLTLSGDWWRLISCVFVHIGIIHLAFNMYALYMAGVYLERMIGKPGYIIAYLCTGVFASMTSLWWHKVPATSAGASGAIFGLYGVFLALLSTNLIPKQIRNGLLQSIGIFVIYNLAYGMKSGVDNAAHIGGLLSGLIVGYLYYIILKAENTAKKMIPVAALVTVLTFVATIFFLEKNIVTTAERNSTKEEIDMFSYKDAGKFNTLFKSILEMQDRAEAPLHDSSLRGETLAEELNNISLPEWEKAGQVIKEMKTYKVSGKAMHKAELMEKYIEIKKEEIHLRIKLIKEKNSIVNDELTGVIEKRDEIIEKLNKL
ncbi:MAG: rhomboid family intramembrane serine protease [Bacteroidota bacterium]|nr:rhomboid family intramembrane serine protease [Bacteroidota bacterium]